MLLCSSFLTMEQRSALVYLQISVSKVSCLIALKITTAVSCCVLIRNLHLQLPLCKWPSLGVKGLLQKSLSAANVEEADTPTAARFTTQNCTMTVLQADCTSQSGEQIRKDQPDFSRASLLFAEITKVSNLIHTRTHASITVVYTKRMCMLAWLKHQTCLKSLPQRTCLQNI